MFYILIGGGTRLKPVRFARTGQFSNSVWTIEGELLKGQKGKVEDFRVPVTAEMQRLITLSAVSSADDLLFPSPKKKKSGIGPVSDQAIENIMRDREREGGWPTLTDRMVCGQLSGPGHQN